jgi:hypothetical protein
MCLIGRLSRHGKPRGQRIGFDVSFCQFSFEVKELNLPIISSVLSVPTCTVSHYGVFMPVFPKTIENFAYQDIVLEWYMILSRKREVLKSSRMRRGHMPVLRWKEVQINSVHCLAQFYLSFLA